MKYFRLKSYDEFFAIAKTDSTILAGGTDLIPRYEQGKQLPSTIIDIKHLPNFIGINKIGENIEIGAGTTIEDIKNNDLIQKYFPALQQAIINFGSVQIRNRATVGGNICNASPAGDTLPALYALDAILLLRNKSDVRTIEIEEFIKGPAKTDLNSNEILQNIIIPTSSNESIFRKLGLREAMAISVVNFAIVYSNTQLIITVGAVAPTILKFNELENLSTEQILDKIDKSISPIDDIRATAKYRRKVLRNMLEFELNKIRK